jgi:uncharacterized repeat protein (TIGR04076 family)
MAYKVKCKLVAFLGDIEHFPCHFGYEIGDEFIYDGEKFIGRVCSGLFSSNMLSVIDTIRYSGNLHFRHFPWLYSGYSRREPSMKKYDGVGWANVKEGEIPEGARREYLERTLPVPPERRGGGGFHCADLRILAVFRAEPFGLSEKGFDLPFYQREMNILEKIKVEPGLDAADVLGRFTKWEKEDIYPPLGPVNLELMLGELEGAGYIELRDGRAYPKTNSA